MELFQDKKEINCDLVVKGQVHVCGDLLVIGTQHFIDNMVVKNSFTLDDGTNVGEKLDHLELENATLRQQLDDKDVELLDMQEKINKIISHLNNS